MYSAVNTRESYWDVLRQPLRDVQVVDLNGDFLAVAWFGHSDGRQILQTQQDKRRMNLYIPVEMRINAAQTRSSLDSPQESSC